VTGVQTCALPIYIPDKELVAFHDVDELASKIRYYLAHPTERDRIAAAGFERTRNNHFYDQRLGDVLEFALRQYDMLDLGRGARPQKGINWEAFERVVARHHRDWKLELAKGSLTALCSLAWGRVRGPRAARRVLFELSWRLAGRHTYSAAGWPGRLFYEVS
jgi:spore maturation protein CgeB